MRTMKTPEPGQNGTGDPLARHGATLLYARYRHDEDTGEGRKTVELVVQRSCPTGEAERAGPRGLGVRARGAASRRVVLRIAWRERDLQGRVKSADSRWDRDRRVWMLRRDAAERLDPLHRVVGGGS